MIDALLREKARLEAEMPARPNDYAIRSRYWDVLHAVSRASLGVFAANFPEIKTPLLFRGGTSDVHNLRVVFVIDWTLAEHRYGEYGFDLTPPRQILDLGAYCGYTAVYLANRFPAAQILCVEPRGGNFDMLAANTAAYARISCEPVAVWHRGAVVRPAGHLLGDWGTYFAPVEAADDPGIPAYTIPEILRMHGWRGADFIKCTIQSGQTEVLGAADRPWLEQVNTVTARNVAGSWQPGEREKLQQAFPEPVFETTARGDHLVIRRRNPRPAKSRPEPLHLVPPPPERRPFRLANIADEFRFYRFADAALQLLPNPPAAPPATAMFPLVLDGHRRFTARIVTGPGSAGTEFALRISRAAGGRAVVRAKHRLPPEAAFEWGVAFEPLSGPCELALSTELSAPGETAAAYFVDPRLL